MFSLFWARASMHSVAWLYTMIRYAIKKKQVLHKFKQKKTFWCPHDYTKLTSAAASSQHFPDSR